MNPQQMPFWDIPQITRLTDETRTYEVKWRGQQIRAAVTRPLGAPIWTTVLSVQGAGRFIGQGYDPESTIRDAIEGARKELDG